MLARRRESRYVGGLMLWIFFVLALAGLWWIIQQRKPPAIPPKERIDPRRLLARQLEKSAAEARASERFTQSQEMALKAAWLRGEPPLGQDEPPSELNPNDYHHLQLVDDIRLRYGELLADGGSPFADCQFKPNAILPYPKQYIGRALRLLIDIAEARAKSVHLEPGVLSGEMVTTVKGCLVLLDSFLEVPPGDLPTDPDENAAFGSRLRQSGTG
jgi:hypothetical protein